MMPSPARPPNVSASEFTGPVLFFDGECGLCQRLVRLMLRLDHHGRLRFAPLQGPTAQAYLRAHDRPTQDFDTIILVPRWDSRDRPDYLVRTAGVIGALRTIGGTVGPTLATLLSLFPRTLRDAGYRVIGRWRYQIFGPWKPRPLSRPEWSVRFFA